MSYRAAYDQLLKQLMHNLSQVDTYESDLDFTAHAGRLVQAEAEKTREFYPSEFLNILRVAFEHQSKMVMAACKREASDANVEADLAKVELRARLKEARAANDREAEHTLWREHEELVSGFRSEIDDASKRVAAISIRVQAFSALMKAFGLVASVPSSDGTPPRRRIENGV